MVVDMCRQICQTRLGSCNEFLIPEQTMTAFNRFPNKMNVMQPALYGCHNLVFNFCIT